ncbi:MAG: hypothetical protein M1376_07115 [Planctomycetes bacterium]|nr:hypothetical protein [Planctomycetota bacterium]
MWEDGATSDENGTTLRFQGARESAAANDKDAASELHLRQLETAGQARQMKQQEAASELQQRHPETAHRLSQDPGSPPPTPYRADFTPSAQSSLATAFAIG